MQRRTNPFVLALILFLASPAQAAYFFGVPVSSALTPSGTDTRLGIQFGTYDLGSGFGLRAGLEVDPPLAAGLNAEGGADLLYSWGEERVFYVGAGAGYVRRSSADALYAAGTVGFDLDADTLVSFFAEVQPRYNLTDETGVLYLRGGINLHLGR